MGLRAGVFCQNGLGDGINMLVLSQNLYLNGWEVDTYQNTIGGMQTWFPHLPVIPYPDLTELPRILSSYDAYFVVQNDTYPFIQQLIAEGKKRFPDRIKVIYFYPSKHIVNERYYTDCQTNPRIPIAQNLYLLCQNILRLPILSYNNGFIYPQELTHRKHLNRIIVHPTSAKPARNWPKEKFVKLALHLQNKGYQLSFIPGGEKEREEWKDILPLGFEIPIFPSLDGLARYIYESGYFIGNDSGPGHLASALKIPTLTFCRRKALADLWAPSLHKCIVLTPSTLVPNIRGFRLRDRHWQKFISVSKAIRAFERLFCVILFFYTI